ncbi:hypothetical protein G4D82_12315 [Flavobacterium sp. CYK-4]|uniref:hypothetical protein n=1 Tax=Flavobacterium lotistagni TaxID=2709660 RepID=UPI00140B623F|nr:hypothetical protein [Flavobacterium lotistagni]NHM08010.1 hypothetical protein [Flavobacterium lotistagni]
MNAVLNPLNVKQLSIEVIDTYDNSRPLIEEYTQQGSPVLSWGSDEDIYSQFMISKLVFNMLVPDVDDAHFFHLFTGDERRYKVKIFTNDPITLTKELIWQGFMLPDIYKEPYKNGCFFVEFTVVDGIQSLKDRVLNQWWYFNRIPMHKVFAMLLKETGLEQNIIVAPSIIPDNLSYIWTDINVPLHHYFDEDDGYKDVFTILEDLLKANGFTLYSFRGYWFITGISRKSEMINYGCYEFDPDGTFVQKVDVINNVVWPMKATDPIISVASPFKRVIVDFKLLQSKQLFSDTVVKAPIETTSFISDFESGLPESKGFAFTRPFTNPYLDRDFSTDFSETFWTGQVKPWLKHESGLDYFVSEPTTWVEADEIYFFAGFRAAYELHGVATEEMALHNYYECPEYPSVEAGVKYKFRFVLDFVDLWTESFSDQSLKQGLYDSMAPFQLFIDENEFISKRPSFTNNSYKYDYQVTPLTSLVTRVKFSLDYEFTAPVSGKLKFRLLAPINNGLGIDVFDYRMIKELSCEIVKDAKNDKLTAIRDINYTTQRKLEVDFISTNSEAIKNNFGVDRLVNPDYVQSVDFEDGAVNAYGTNAFFVMSGNPLYKHLFLKAFEVSEDDFEKIVFNNLRSNFFVETAGGVSKYIRSWYVRKEADDTCKMAYLTSYDQGVMLPDGYDKEYEIQIGDNLNYVFFDYGTENLAARSSWKIYNFINTDNHRKFNETLAKLYHFSRPRPIFVIDTEYKKMVWPNEIMAMNYKDQVRNFIHPTVKVNLAKGVTKVLAVEAIFESVNDISYE